MASNIDQSDVRGEIYDTFRPNAELLSTWEQIEAIQESNEQRTTVKINVAPIRFDMNIKLHQGHAMDKANLVALHELVQKTGAIQTAELEKTERFYRTAVQLRSEFSTLVGRRSYFKDPELRTASGFAGVLERRRIQLFREGAEKVQNYGIYRGMFHPGPSMIFTRDLVLLEKIWEYQGKPSIVELQVLQAMFQARVQPVPIEYIAAFFLKKVEKFVCFSSLYQRHWHEIRMERARRALAIAQGAII